MQLNNLPDKGAIMCLWSVKDFKHTPKYRRYSTQKMAVYINGIKYTSVTAASKSIGLSITAVRNRLDRSYGGYEYL